MRDNYLVFRDTLRGIDAASSRLTRDIRTASGALLLSRSRAVLAACVSTLRSIDATRKSLLESSSASRAPERARTGVERSLGELRPALSRCVTEFSEYSDPARSNAVRDAGARSAMDAVNSGKKFERAAEALLATLGITVRPFGSGASPFAGTAN